MLSRPPGRNVHAGRRATAAAAGPGAAEPPATGRRGRGAPSCGARRRWGGAAAAKAALCVCLLAAPRAEANLFESLAHFKPPSDLLEQGKRAVEAVAATAKQQPAAIENTLQKVASSVKPPDFNKVAEVGSQSVTTVLKGAEEASQAISNALPQDLLHSIKREDAEQVGVVIADATPKIAEVLRHTDAHQVMEVIKGANPQDIERAMQAVGMYQWWRGHWWYPTSIAAALQLFVVVAWCHFRRRYCNRNRHKRVLPLLQQSDTALLSTTGADEQPI